MKKSERLELPPDDAENLVTALRYLSCEARRSGFVGTARLIDDAARSLSKAGKVATTCN